MKTLYWEIYERKCGENTCEKQCSGNTFLLWCILNQNILPIHSLLFHPNCFPKQFGSNDNFFMHLIQRYFKTIHFLWVSSCSTADKNILLYVAFPLLNIVEHTENKHRYSTQFSIRQFHL